MIAIIKGKLIIIKKNSIIVECNGIGFEIFIPLSDIAKLTEKINQEILLFTHMFHKEDNMTLYGFLDEKTKETFLNLLKVSGIGPKVALKVVSSIDVKALYEIIEKQDIKALTRIPGIGDKTAKQIILDMKGILAENKEELTLSYENELIEAMINLGYKQNEVLEKLNSIKPLSNDFEKDFKTLLKKLAGK